MTPSGHFLDSSDDHIRLETFITKNIGVGDEG